MISVSNPWVIKSSASKSLDTPSCCEICCFNSSTVLQDPRSCPDSAQRATSGADVASEAMTRWHVDTLARWHVAQRCGVNIWLRDLIFVFEDDEKSNKESHDKRKTVSNIPIYYHFILSIPSWSLVWDYACFQMMEKITSLGVRYRRGTGWSKWNLFGIHGVPRRFEGPS